MLSEQLLWAFGNALGDSSLELNSLIAEKTCLIQTMYDIMNQNEIYKNRLTTVAWCLHSLSRLKCIPPVMLSKVVFMGKILLDTSTERNLLLEALWFWANISDTSEDHIL